MLGSAATQRATSMQTVDVTKQQQQHQQQLSLPAQGYVLSLSLCRINSPHIQRTVATQLKSSSPSNLLPRARPTENFRKLLQLEIELRTHLAATERRILCPHGDPSFWEDPDEPGTLSKSTPAWCWDEAEREKLFGEYGPGVSLEEGVGVSWLPDGPDWVWEMSWLQRHLVDVYAVYGALVMGVGLLMKLTWNLVW